MKMIGLNFTRLIAFITVAVMLMTLCACSPTTETDTDAETEAETESETESETVSEINGESATEKETDGETASELFYDYMGNDLSVFINLAPYKNTEFEYTETPVTREDAEKYVDEMLRYYGIYTEETGRAAETGDTLNIDYKGLLNGEEFSGGTAAGRTISLTESSGYISGFAEGLVGAMPGETVTLNLTFPDNYYEEYAGKAVVFEVTVNYIEDYTLTDKIVTDYFQNIASTAESFLEQVQADLYEEKNGKEVLKELIWNAVIADSNVISYPEEAYRYYYDSYVEYYKNEALSNNLEYEAYLETMGITDDDIKSDSENCVKNDMIFYSIVKNESISLSEEEYAAKVQEIADYYGATTDAIESYYGRDYLEQSFLWNKVLDFLYDSNTCVKAN